MSKSVQKAKNVLYLLSPGKENSLSKLFLGGKYNEHKKRKH